MDVADWVLEHKARDAIATVSFIDEYCGAYEDLFPEVIPFHVNHDTYKFVPDAKFRVSTPSVFVSRFS
jgi:hypothetical protein